MARGTKATAGQAASFGFGGLHFTDRGWIGGAKVYKRREWLSLVRCLCVYMAFLMPLLIPVIGILYL
jgi:hypothetical protein